MNVYQVIHRPLVTEKGVEKKDNERTLCFEVALEANKTHVKAAVEKLFKMASCAAGASSRAIVRIGRRPTYGSRPARRFRTLRRFNDAD